MELPALPVREPDCLSRRKQAGGETFLQIPAKFTHQKSDIVQIFINLTFRRKLVLY